MSGAGSPHDKQISVVVSPSDCVTFFMLYTVGGTATQTNTIMHNAAYLSNNSSQHSVMTTFWLSHHEHVMLCIKHAYAVANFSILLPELWHLSLLIVYTLLFTISRPPTASSLKITNRSFQYASPHLWNKLPLSFCEPYPHPPSLHPTQVGSTLSSPPFSPSITSSLFHSRLKTHLFLKSFPP